MVLYAPTIGSILLSLHKGADTMTARLKVKVLKACLPLAAVAALTAVPYQAAIDGSFMPASAQAKQQMAHALAKERRKARGKDWAKNAAEPTLRRRQTMGIHRIR